MVCSHSTLKTVANVFTQGKYVAVYPMLTKADASISLVDFTDEVGIPQVLMTDLASEFLVSILILLSTVVG